MKKVFADSIKALTFAIRSKITGWQQAERSLKVWKQQHVNQVFTVRLRKQIHSIEDCQISREKR